MKDREKILRYFSATGEEAKDMAVRLLDIADSVDRGRPFAVGPFMSPFAAQVGQTIAAHMKTVAVKTSGGYHEAERIRVAFARNDYDGPVDFGLTALKVTWDDRYRLIGHRDVLGSLMGLGIDGDIRLCAGRTDEGNLHGFHVGDDSPRTIGQVRADDGRHMAHRELLDSGYGIFRFTMIIDRYELDGLT